MHKRLLAYHLVSNFMCESKNQLIADSVANASAEISSSVLDVVTGDEKSDLFA